MNKKKINKIDKTQMPNHIAVVMDGNRRWAKEKGKSILQGHKAGMETIRRLSIFQTKKSPVQIKMLTLYALSEDNRSKRSPAEVASLMMLFKKGFSDLAKDKRPRENGIKVSVFGKYKTLPKGTAKAIEESIKKTKNNKDFFLNFCIAYDGQSEIVEACKKIMKNSADLKSATRNISKKKIKENMFTAGFPAPDIIIRPGKEKRISGFMLWDSSYSELHFLDKHWPDVSQDDILDAILEYQKTQRRYGK